MTLKISTPVLLCLIAALLYLAAQQPPRQNRERVERTPKTPPENGTQPYPIYPSSMFNPLESFDLSKTDN